LFATIKIIKYEYFVSAQSKNLALLPPFWLRLNVNTGDCYYFIYSR